MENKANYLFCAAKLGRSDNLQKGAATTMKNKANYLFCAAKLGRSDNLQKGAATNAVQILELLIRNDYGK
jgi:N-acetyl-gamma-glutamylphosphate reductase